MPETPVSNSVLLRAAALARTRGDEMHADRYEIAASDHDGDVCGFVAAGDVCTAERDARQYLAASPMPGQVLMKVTALDAEYVEGDHERVITDLLDANVITSKIDGDPWWSNLHKPVLDIDHAVKVVPSSTPGHCHLYIDKSMTWGQYTRLLDVLADVGLVEPGYVAASIARGHTAVRLPWIKKGDV